MPETLWSPCRFIQLGESDDEPAVPSADASNEEIETDADPLRMEAAHIGHDQLTGSEPR